MLKSNLIMFLMFIAIVTSSALHAQQRKEQSGKRTPPKVAVEACANSSAGQQCSFEGKRGSESGTCFSPSEERPLACKPDRQGKKKKKH